MSERVFLKQTELQDKYSISSTYCTKICRMIDAHPEIYSYPSLGTKYNKYAFFHAYAFYKKLKNGDPVPLYDISEIKDVIGQEEEQEDIDYNSVKAYVEHQLKEKLIGSINDWFKVTSIPKDMKAVEFSNIARKAMVAIIAE